MRRATVVLIVMVALASTACGSDEASPDIGTSTTSVTTETPSGEGPTVTACDLFTEEDAEAIVGTDLNDNSRDDYDCTFFSAEDPLVSASISIRPWAATGDDITALHDALPEGTLEDLPGLGEAAVYYQDGAGHSLQFVKGGVYVTAIVTALPDGGDVREAEQAIAELVATRL